MDDLDELQRRLAWAMERIAKGLDGLEAPRPAAEPQPAPAADPEEIEALKTALEEERTANAQLEERVRAIKLRQDRQVSSVQKAMEEKDAALAGMEREMGRLRAINDALRAINVDLRAAAEEHVAEPALIDAALRAEAEALRADHAAAQAEARAILSTLGPLAAGEDGAENTAEKETQ